MVLFWPSMMVLMYGLLRLMGSAVPAPQFPVLAPLVGFLVAFVAAMGEEYDPRIVGPIVTFGAIIVTVVWGPQTLARYRNPWPGRLHSSAS